MISPNGEGVDLVHLCKTDMTENNGSQKPQEDTVLPIDEIVIEGTPPEDMVLPRLEEGRIVMEDGTQFEMTESGGRWLDAGDREIMLGEPFQTNDGVYSPSVSREELEAIDRHLKSQGDEGIFPDEE